MKLPEMYYRNPKVQKLGQSMVKCAYPATRKGLRWVPTSIHDSMRDILSIFLSGLTVESSSAAHLARHKGMITCYQVAGHMAGTPKMSGDSGLPNSDPQPQPPTFWKPLRTCYFADRDQAVQD